MRAWARALRGVPAILLTATMLSGACIALDAVAPSAALATANTTCNREQQDNTFISRYASAPADPGHWVKYTWGTISYFNYALCTNNTGGSVWQTSSGAWVAVEGPFGSDPSLGGNSIAQVGYIKCGYAQLGCLDIPAEKFGRVIYFYAQGNADDIWHMPWPQYLGDATSGNHTFFATWDPGHWTFMEQKTDWTETISIEMADYTNWPNVRSETANEVWNSGDQLGGYSGSPQYFSAKYYTADNVMHDYTMNPSLSGHCYRLPSGAGAASWGWAKANGWGANSWKTWTWVDSRQPC